MTVRSWILPSTAGSFGLGVLLLGKRLSPTGGVVLSCGGLVVMVGAWGRARAAQRRRERADALLVRAGLMSTPEGNDALSPVGPAPSARDRILGAAGVGPERESEPDAAGRSSPLRVALCLLGVGFVGAGWAAVRAPPVEALGVLDGRAVTLDGTASSDVRRFDAGWGLDVSVERIVVAGSGPADAAVVDLSARVWLQGKARPPPVEASQPVEARGTLYALRPEEGGFEEYLRDRGVAATVAVDRVLARGPTGNPALRLANAVRRGLRQGATATMSNREAELLLGLAIGDTSGMDAEVEEDFRASGLGHLLAVSGSNVAMFLVPLLALATAMRASPATRLLVGIAGVGFFALVTRWEPSVLRASAMAALALGGAFAGRPRSTAPILGGGVLVLLVADPWLARSVGFQLSVAATGGIVALAGPLSARMRWVPRPLALAAGATLGAQIAVTPLLLLHFGAVATVTLFANLLAFPAVPPALLLGLGAAGTAHAWPAAARLIGDLAEIPVGYLAEVADRAARAPLPQIVSEGLALPVLIGILGGVAAWRLRRGKRPVGSMVALVVAGVLLWPVGGGAGPPALLTVTFLDVGQGDASVIRTPDGATIVVDSGPDEQEVARVLARMGVRRIDLAVASHAHADHVSGFPAIFARFPVALFIEPGCPHDAPQYRRMLEAATAEGIPIRHPRGGERLEVGSVALEVLGPDECMGEGPNNDSLVLLVHPAAGGEAGSVLFTGDAEEAEQRDLLADGDTVAAAVLKVPHQGGATSIEEFFEAVRAGVAVVSVGPNEYGHPVPWVLDSLRRTGALVLRTDQAGDVTVRFGSEGVLVESAR